MSDRVPPYPADTRAKGWRFELDYEKIEQSSTWDLAAEVPMAQHALLMMWLVAWRQEPCGTLPNDPDLIRAKCKVPAKLWPALQPILMRGWWLADDGNLYHDTITARVLEMIAKRAGDASRKKLYDQKFYAIRERDGGACVYCGATKYLSLDHLIASSRGGTGDETNLVTACRRCNSHKGARTPDEAGMSFVNSGAEAIWHRLRAEVVAFGSATVTPQERGRNAGGTPTERGSDDTDHLPPRTKRVSKPSASHPPDGGQRFGDFWLAWPKNERKQDKAKCLDHWKRNDLDAIADAIIDDVRTKRGTTKWAEGYVEAPLVYLRGKRWEDGVTPDGSGGNDELTWHETRSGIERKGVELGIGKWDQAAWENDTRRESFQQYTARVYSAARHSPRAAA